MKLEKATESAKHNSMIKGVIANCCWHWPNPTARLHSKSKQDSQDTRPDKDTLQSTTHYQLHHPMA
jgi:hypothetical protein